MKDGVSFTYKTPVVEVISLNQDDVIQTSILSLFDGKFLLKKSWNSNWTGMETNSVWEDLD